MPRKKVEVPKRVRKAMTVAEAQQLEIYYFRLVMFSNSNEYHTYSNKDKSRIDKEIAYMSVAIPIIQNLFEIVAQRRSVVAWKKEFENETPVYRFSSAAVLSEALEITESNVYRCLQGTRLSAGGYHLMYEDEFEEEQAKSEENE